MSLQLDPLIALPAVASTVVIYTSSLQSALLRVYLPVLLLLPDGYYWGWPPLCFHQYAVLPMGLVLCWWAYNGRWRWSWLDLGVLAFVGWTIASDVHADGFTDIVLRVLTPILSALFPYMAGKLLIEQTGIRLPVARRFVFLVFVVSMIAVYEFRFASNPFERVFGMFIASPNDWTAFGTQIRYGLGRTRGPYGAAILAGSIVAIAILLHRYLMHFDFWEKRFRWFPRVKLNKPWIMFWVLIAGSLMTISRGPWLALAVGAVVTSIGTAENRWRSVRRGLAILLIGGGLVYAVGKAYLAGGSQVGSQEDISSAVYRTQLLDEYQNIAKQKSFWGWGPSDFPRVPGMVSVDNYYLLLALMHGVTGMVLFTLLLLISVARLLWVGMFDNDLPPDSRALLFTISSIIVTVGVAVATVFLGSQVLPVFFLFLGWSDACLLYRARPSLR